MWANDRVLRAELPTLSKFNQRLLIFFRELNNRKEFSMNIRGNMDIQMQEVHSLPASRGNVGHKLHRTTEIGSKVVLLDVPSILKTASPDPRSPTKWSVPSTALLSYLRSRLMLGFVLSYPFM